MGMRFYGAAKKVLHKEQQKFGIDDYEKRLLREIEISFKDLERWQVLREVCENLIPADKDIVVCVKTTDCDPKKSEILQLTIVEYGGTVIYNSMFNPEYAIMRSEVSDINGITYDMVKDAPRFRDEAPKIYSILLSARTIICCNSWSLIPYIREEGCVWRSDYDLIGILSEYDTLIYRLSYDNDVAPKFDFDDEFAEMKALYGKPWGSNRATDTVEYCKKVIELYNMITPEMKKRGLRTWGP